MNYALKMGLIVLLSGYWHTNSFAQNYTLEQCQTDALQTSPVLKQKLYYESMASLELLNAKKSNLPQLTFSGQATYQSDVFQLPFTIPGSEPVVIPKDQYRATIGVQQKIYDGQSVSKNNELINAGNELNQQQVEVELYQIKSVINQLYFGILFFQEQESVIKSSQTTLQSQLKEVQSLVDNGVVLRSSLYSVKKELLILQQQLIELESNKAALMDMLSKWMDNPLEKGAILEVPTIAFKSEETEIKRPELLLFEMQKRQIEANKSLLGVSNSPKLFAFANGGVGNPNPYNFFQTDWSGFYMVGVKIEWNIFDYGRKNNNVKVLDNRALVLESKKENYLKLTAINLLQNDRDIQKYEALLDEDKEIMALQKVVVEESYSQLNNGIITSTQYLMEVNSAMRAEINMKIHELSLIKSKIDLLTNSGNL